LRLGRLRSCRGSGSFSSLRDLGLCGPTVGLVLGGVAYRGFWKCVFFLRSPAPFCSSLREYCFFPAFFFLHADPRSRPCILCFLRRMDPDTLRAFFLIRGRHPDRPMYIAFLSALSSEEAGWVRLLIMRFAECFHQTPKLRQSCVFPRSNAFLLLSYPSFSAGPDPWIYLIAVGGGGEAHKTAFWDLLQHLARLTEIHSDTSSDF
jgi:hypothetical protein